TGRTLWKTDREPASAWTSPVVWKRGRGMVIVSAAGKAQGYDLLDGRLLWQAGDLTGNLIPSPAVEGDCVYIGASVSSRSASGQSAAESNCCLKLVERDGKVEVERVWQARKAVCYYASPLVYRGYVYYVNSAGVLYCLDSRTGQEQYAERIDSACWASPVAVGDRIYFFGRNGVTTVVRAGKRFEKLASNTLWTAEDAPLPEVSYAYTPRGATAPRAPSAEYLDPIVYGVAVVDRAILIRTGTHLFCVR
ncbi:MAG: PQQ-like beta-propeller repeat protein, partial [Chthonomonadaceae bacterium]|nr:PQQ-like beta-propeller repeat protein [Chthonomonadaceae bacterium]